MQFEQQSSRPSANDNVRSEPQPELKALTGLRGLAATVVALAHIQPPLPFQTELLFLWQNAAVDLFFCLSGFTLSYVYGRENFSLSGYLAARFARVYPLYFATLVIAWAVYVWPLIIDPKTYPSATASLDFVRQALMVNAWPIVGSGVHWNFPAWSISIECFCYIILFPALLTRSAPRSMPSRLVCLISLSLVSYRLFMAYFDERLTSPEVYDASNQMSYWVPMLRGICGFTAGWIAFASFQKRDWLFERCTRYSAALWFGFAAVLVLRYFGLASTQLLVFLFPFLVLAASDQNSTTSKMLGSSVPHFLGVISYSIYMTHFLVFTLFLRVGPKLEAWPGSLYVLLVGTVLAVSICSYLTVERPARNAIRGHWRISRGRNATWA